MNKRLERAKTADKKDEEEKTRSSQFHGIGADLILLEFFMILFLVLGYLIRFRGRVDFIAGFREGRIQDESGLTRFLGTILPFSE